MSVREIARKLGRTETAIKQMASLLGVAARGIVWTKQRLNYVMRHFRKQKYRAIAIALGLTEGSVKQFAHMQRLGKQLRWTQEEKKYLNRNYGKRSVRRIARGLGRSIFSVYAMARAMKLRGVSRS